MTDHTKAVNWVRDNNHYIGANLDKDNSDVKSLHNMFMMYVSCLAKNKDKHVFEIDEIDDWYFNNYNTDKRFENIEHLFPEGIFILKYKDLYWKYKIVYGQGSWTTVKILPDNDIEDFCKCCGVSKERFEDKVYHID